MVLAIDYEYVLRYAIAEFLDRDIEIEAYIDSRTVACVIAKDRSTAKPRLKTEMMALKESYVNGEMYRIDCIPRCDSAADVLTKERLSKKTATWNSMTGSKLRNRTVQLASI